MDQRSEPILPDPWQDPEFSRTREDAKAGVDSRPGLARGGPRMGGRRARSGAQAGILFLVLAAVWFGLLLDPMLGPILLSLLLALGATLAVLIGAMGLGCVGFGLFAAG